MFYSQDIPFEQTINEQKKMNLARQLLDTKIYSVSDVGYQLGYSNLSHFTEAFKKEFGINPKIFHLHFKI